MTKGYRQAQILKLIRARAIPTQDDLAKALAEECGIKATQVTLSRDIRDLGLVKTQSGYRQISAPAPPASFGPVPPEFLRDVRQAQNLLVLRTSPGHANAIAVAIDQQDLPDILGTLAGDDTVLVIASDTKAADRLRAQLLSRFRVAAG